MKPRAIRPSELSPDARIDAAKRALVSALDDLVDAKLAKGAARSEWVSQYDSPLPSWKHLELVRKRKIPGVKDGEYVYVRRSDLDAYLAKKGVRSSAAVAEEESVEEMMVRIERGAGGRG